MRPGTQKEPPHPAFTGAAVLLSRSVVLSSCAERPRQRPASGLPLPAEGSISSVLSSFAIILSGVVFVDCFLYTITQKRGKKFHNPRKKTYRNLLIQNSVFITGLAVPAFSETCKKDALCRVVLRFVGMMKLLSWRRSACGPGGIFCGPRYSCEEGPWQRPGRSS